MKKFLVRGIIFLIPLLLIPVVELFVLPMDFFTFRVWEAVLVETDLPLLKGPFYPNVNIRKIEQGDSAPHNKLAVNKDVQWITDKYGFRQVNKNVKRYNIVIIGDSFIAGTSLTQADTLSEVLEKKTNLQVYPFAPSDIYRFWLDPRFAYNHPDLVIVASAEKRISGLPKMSVRTIPGPITGSDLFFYNLSLNNFFGQFGVVLDRLYKQNMRNFIATYLNNQYGQLRGYVATDNSMIFRDGKDVLADVPEKDLNEMSKTIENYNEVFKSQGIRFLFLPIPTKENIYYQLVPGGKKSNSLKTLIAKLKQDNVPVIDTQSLFETAALNHPGQLLYQKDDSHWNPEAVKMTADAIIKTLR